MAKGFFTQGVMVLFRGAPHISAIREAINAHEVVRELPANGEWAIGGATLIVALRPEVNGYIAVDVVDRAWPDHMGDVKNEAMIFAAWSTGHFGPLTYPGNLERAQQQSWAWPEVREIAPRHDAFVRVRSSYVFGATNDIKVMPADYDPLPELFAVTRIAADLLKLPNALSYFNPAGEVLRSSEGVDELLVRRQQQDLLPLDLWSNARFFNLGGEPRWFLMDTVGMWQLDTPDHEACFSDAYDPSEVDNFLRNASNYVFENGPVIDDGDTMDGPGDIRWRAYSVEQGLLDPPREAMRWFPDDGSTPPPEVLPPAG
jgi:hypothetical protein